MMMLVLNEACFWWKMECFLTVRRHPMQCADPKLSPGIHRVRCVCVVARRTNNSHKK